MPRSMLRRLPIVACALALTAPLGLAACGSKEPGIDEPAREGLAIEMEGVDYTIFITRELNPRITPDSAYVSTEAPSGQALYGVFLKTCNISKDERTTATEFTVRDNQDNTFHPEPLPDDNQFAYAGRTLDPQECIPEAGSVAQLGPTAGAMLLFQLPLENTENRPLELEIEHDGQKRTFELDI
ncbi:MAG: hypothetical protein QOD71_1297 [Thermoleophilaceae bacterium]|jgi:hypothetical protein|nr:hypothetical protein [Thermoleophilaceae bacterium]